MLELPPGDSPARGTGGTEVLRGKERERIPRILVVEDEPEVAALIADVLRDEGMEVDVAPDGERAFERAQSEYSHAVVCETEHAQGKRRGIFRRAGASAQPATEAHLVRGRRRKRAPNATSSFRRTIFLTWASLFLS